MAALVVQLSDLHLRPDDPAARAALERALDAVRALRPLPLAVLVTGDLTDLADAASAQEARAALDTLGLPVHVVPGNHDARASLRAAFGLAGAPDDPIRGSVALGPLRLVLADSTVPGHDHGATDAAWLRERLAEDTTTPTILAQHHPPLRIGVAEMDAIGLPAADTAALAAVLADAPNVVRVVAGHVHRTCTAAIAGVPVFAAPSPYTQLLLDLAGHSLGVTREEPGGFAVHVVHEDGAVTSHMLPL